MLKKVDLAKIKDDLLTRKSEIEAELESLNKDGISDREPQDDADQVVSITMETVRNSLHESELNEYVNIVGALDAIEAGTYGICKECASAISEIRLKYYPNAQLCIACQEKSESASN